MCSQQVGIDRLRITAMPDSESGRSTIFLAQFCNSALYKITPKWVRVCLSKFLLQQKQETDLNVKKHSARYFVVLPLLASFAAFGTAQPANAFYLFGVHLWGPKKTDSQDEIIDPKHYKITVQAAPTSQVDTKASKEQIEENIKLAKNGSAMWAERKKGVASGSGGLLVRARGDYRRILAGFYAAAHYGPIISIKINGQEAADIPDGTDFPDKNTITITVDGGASYKFSETAVSHGNWSARQDAWVYLPSANLRKPKEIREALALANPEQTVEKIIDADKQKIGYKNGAVANSGVVFSAESMVVDKWRQQGYAKAKITDKTVVANHRDKTVATVIEVDPGRRARFGKVSIHNVSKKPRMKTDYVAWLMGIEEGKIYSPDTLAKARDRLNNLDVFSSAGLQEADKIDPNGYLPLDLTLQEKALHRFGGGGSYSTIDGVGLSAYWLHRNLFGHAEKLRFDTSVSNISSNNSSRYTKDIGYSVGATFNRPGIITPDTNYYASLKASRDISDSYLAKGVYFSNGFNRTFNSRLSGTLGVDASKVQVQDDVWGKRDFTIISLLEKLLYDSRDNADDATKGYYLDVNAQPFYEANHGNFAGKITAEGRTYFSFDKNNRFILALRGKLGSIAGAEIQDLPSNMLFFIGGGGSVRGYSYQSIGVYERNGSTIGGRSMAEGSAEVRTMLTDKFGLVGFADAGVVGEKPTLNFDQDLKVGVGLGVRYKTGMGPLRFDVALPLNREKGDTRYGFYIGIGQSF